MTDWMPYKLIYLNFSRYVEIVGSWSSIIYLNLSSYMVIMVIYYYFVFENFYMMQDRIQTSVFIFISQYLKLNLALLKLDLTVTKPVSY